TALRAAAADAEFRRACHLRASGLARAPARATAQSTVHGDRGACTRGCTTVRGGGFQRLAPAGAIGAGTLRGPQRSAFRASRPSSAYVSVESSRVSSGPHLRAQRAQ